MPFDRKFQSILQKKDKSFINVTYDSGVNLKFFDCNNKLLKTKSLISGDFSFVDSNFNIDENDNFYSVINNKKNSLNYYFINNNSIISYPILTYSNKKIAFKFPVIKRINNNIHLFFYLISDNNKYNCYLYHFYYKENIWIKNKISHINCGILTNYVALYDNDLLTVFYFNKISCCEELYISIFDFNNNIWSNPYKITNNHNSKIYLSVIYNNGVYHIVYSENNDNCYVCKYISLSISSNKIIVHNNKILYENLACTFPHIIINNDMLYAQWIEYSNLSTSYSNDLGNNWSKPTIFDDSSTIMYSPEIIRYDIQSNYLTNNNCFVKNIYGYSNSYIPLGIDIK